MLKEIIAGIPTNKRFTIQEIQDNLTQELIDLIHQNTGVDVTKNFNISNKLK